MKISKIDPFGVNKHAQMLMVRCIKTAGRASPQNPKIEPYVGQVA